MNNQLIFEVITDEGKARELWEKFSPHKILDDEWDFRYIWFKYLQIPFHFIVGYDANEAVGLLPLQRNTVLGLDAKLLNMTPPFLEYFGGVDSDNNGIFTLPGYEDTASQFLEQIKEPALLNSLAQPVFGGKQAEFYLDKFEVDLKGISDFESYVDLHFTGKTRRNIRHELRRNKMEGYEVRIEDGDISDLETLFEFSKERFGERSSFHIEERQQVYKDFFKFLNVDVFKILLNGKVKAVVYGIVHHNVYTGINAGYDYSIPNMGKFIFTSTIPRAIQKGCTLYDVGQGTSGWKDRLHLTKVPQYNLKLNA